MASKWQTELAGLLLKEYFGEIIEDVGMTLIKFGPSHLRFICMNCHQSIKNVKKSLITLIQYHIVSFGTNTKGFVTYAINVQHIMLLKRYPKYIYIAKLLYNEFGEYIVEEILKQGQMAMSKVIERVANRLSFVVPYNDNAQLPKTIHDVFVKLVETRFIQISHSASDSDDDNSSSAYKIPSINLDFIKVKQEEDETLVPPAKKRKKGNDDQIGDDGIYWKVNFDRFHQYMRDKLIVDAIKTHFDDEKAGEVTGLMLRLSETKSHPWTCITSPISKQDIVDAALKEDICSSASQVDSYLRVFNDDFNHRYIYKNEEKAGGGTYCINAMKIMNDSVSACLASIVEDRFGSKCCRIFRLLLNAKFLQQKSIEDMAMIMGKEAKEMTFTLFQEGYIRANQYPKTIDFAPSRTSFVYNVDLHDLSLTIIQRSYKAIYNTISRRNHQNHQNKSLIERKNFIDAIIARTQQESSDDVQQQVDDLNQSFSTHDRELLTRLNSSSNTLELSELFVDETIFLLQSWLHMSTFK